MEDKIKIPTNTLKQYYKRFANGEQYIYVSPYTGDIIEQSRQYYWQPWKVYNMIKPLLAVYGKNLTDSQVYGREGLVSLLEHWQRKYNDIMNMHGNHLDFATYGHVVVEDGSIDVDELSEEGLAPGKVIVYRQGGNWPHIEKDALNPQAYIESADYCYKQMVRVCEMFVNGRADDAEVVDHCVASGCRCECED